MGARPAGATWDYGLRPTFDRARFNASVRSSTLKLGPKAGPSHQIRGQAQEPGPLCCTFLGQILAGACIDRAADFRIYPGRHRLPRESTTSTGVSCWNCLIRTGSSRVRRRTPGTAAGMFSAGREIANRIQPGCLAGRPSELHRTAWPTPRLAERHHIGNTMRGGLQACCGYRTLAGKESMGPCALQYRL